MLIVASLLTATGQLRHASSNPDCNDRTGFLPYAAAHLRSTSEVDSATQDDLRVF